MPNISATLVVIISSVGLSVWGRSVRVTQLQVPSAAVLGQPVQLGCSYELGAEELYVVKWYKDGLEFYRYEPKDQNQSVYFPQPGVDIDLSRSNSNRVFLRNVALDSAGTYKCQVSTDAPTYSCVQAVKDMNVIILPLKGPQIHGGRDSYNFGDNITLNCTSDESRPAAKLNWLVNNKYIPDDDTNDHGVISKNHLEVSSKSLHLRVTEGIFRKGKADIKCEATFYDKVAMISKEVTILEVNVASRFSHSLLFLIVSTLLPFSSILQYFLKIPS